MLDTALCRLLGCRYPIVQTAMGWVADENLVAATCNAGGFGFLAGATIPPDAIAAAIERTMELSEHGFGVNFHMHQPNAEQIVDLVVAHRERVRAVSYGRGPSERMIKRLKDAGVVCMPTVGALRHALKAVKLGADAITIQGAEGGGHTGTTPTVTLLSQTLEAVDVPVVAAGGFKDGRGLAAALAWGAAGVAMGTRFLLTADSPVPEATKRAYLDCADAGDIVVSKALDGLPQRMVRNDFLRRLEKAGAMRRLLIALGSAVRYRRFTQAGWFELLRAGLDMRAGEDGLKGFQSLMSANAPMIIQKAMVDGRPQEGALPSGQIAAAIDDLPSCAGLIADIVAQAEARLLQLREGENA